MSENRAKIIQVATRLFAEHGYDAVGTQQIVDTAGVAKPTLYHYFKSKQGLFDAIVQEQAGDLLASVREAAEYKGDITWTITQLVRTYFEYAQEKPAFYRLMLVTWFAPPSSEYYLAVSDFQRQQLAILEQLFEVAVKDHGNMRGRHTQYAISLKGMIDTYVGLALQGYTTLNASDFVYRIVHQFMHGIFS